MSKKYWFTALSVVLACLFLVGRIVGIWSSQTEPIDEQPVIYAPPPPENMWTTPHITPNDSVIRIQRRQGEQQIDLYATPDNLARTLQDLSARGDLSSMVLRHEGTGWHIHTSLLPPETEMRGTVPKAIPEISSLEGLLRPAPSPVEQDQPVALSPADTGSANTNQHVGFVQFANGQRLTWQWDDRQLHLGSTE